MQQTNVKFYSNLTTLNPYFAAFRLHWRGAIAAKHRVWSWLKMTEETENGILNDGLCQNKIKPNRTIDISIKSEIYFCEFDMRQTKFSIDFCSYCAQLTPNFINNSVCYVTYHGHYDNITCASVHGKLHACIFILWTWWRHQMETFPLYWPFVWGNSPVTGEFPIQKPVTRSFDGFFDLRLNNRLSKQWRGWWFGTPSHPLWRHSNERQWIMPQQKCIPCGNNFDHYFILKTDLYSERYS